MEEQAQSNRLFAEAVPVWYSQSKEVNPEWLSACKEERNLTSNLIEQIDSPLNLGKAYQKVKHNAGAAGVDGVGAIIIRRLLTQCSQGI